MKLIITQDSFYSGKSAEKLVQMKTFIRKHNCSWQYFAAFLKVLQIQFCGRSFIVMIVFQRNEILSSTIYTTIYLKYTARDLVSETRECTHKVGGTQVTPLSPRVNSPRFIWDRTLQARATHVMHARYALGTAPPNTDMSLGTFMFMQEKQSLA